jgi:hypothetical protein
MAGMRVETTITLRQQARPGGDIKTRDQVADEDGGRGQKIALIRAAV